MNSLYKLEIVNLIASKCRREAFREVAEVGQYVARLDIWHIIDDVQESHGGTSISGCLFEACHCLESTLILDIPSYLIGEPNVLRAARFLLILSKVSVPEKEDETVDWLPTNVRKRAS